MSYYISMIIGKNIAYTFFLLNILIIFGMDYTKKNSKYYYNNILPIKNNTENWAD